MKTFLILLVSMMALRAAEPAGGTATLAIPAGAVVVESNLYRHTDAQGKTWIYRRTPFGITRAEAQSVAPARPRHGTTPGPGTMATPSALNAGPLRRLPVADQEIGAGRGGASLLGAPAGGVRQAGGSNRCAAAFFLSLALAGAMIPALLAQAPSRSIEDITQQRQAQQPQPQPAQPAPAQQAAPAKATAPAQEPKMADQGLLSMDNVNLIEMVNLISKLLKINIMIDPRVRGSVTIHTYGEVKPVDLMTLLQTILRVNASTIVKVGDLYRIVPVNAVSQLPLEPIINADAKTLPDDEQMVLT